MLKSYSYCCEWGGGGMDGEGILAKLQRNAPPSVLQTVCIHVLKYLFIARNGLFVRCTVPLLLIDGKATLLDSFKQPSDF